MTVLSFPWRRRPKPPTPPASISPGDPGYHDRDVCIAERHVDCAVGDAYERGYSIGKTRGEDETIHNFKRAARLRDEAQLAAMVEAFTDPESWEKVEGRAHAIPTAYGVADLLIHDERGSVLRTPFPAPDGYPSIEHLPNYLADSAATTVALCGAEMDGDAEGGGEECGECLLALDSLPVKSGIAWQWLERVEIMRIQARALSADIGPAYDRASDYAIPEADDLADALDQLGKMQPLLARVAVRLRHSARTPDTVITCLRGLTWSVCRQCQEMVCDADCPNPDGRPQEQASPVGDYHIRYCQGAGCGATCACECHAMEGIDGR